MISNKLTSLSSFNIEHIITDVVTNHSILNTFGETLVSSYKEEAIQYFKKYINQSDEYIICDILQHYTTWDNYAFSILYLRILIGLHRTLKIKNKFIILFMKLLVGNISLNPLKRLSIKDTTNKFAGILDILDISDYKALLQALQVFV